MSIRKNPDICRPDFEENELNNAKACVLRELKEETGITEKMLNKIEMRYVTLRRIKHVIEHYLETGMFHDKVYGGIADGEQVIFIELPEY